MSYTNVMTGLKGRGRRQKLLISERPVIFGYDGLR